MKVTGEDFIEAITNKIKDDGGLCYDSTILRYIRKMTDGQLRQVFHFGDVQEWHNERKRKAGLSDYVDRV